MQVNPLDAGQKGIAVVQTLQATAGVDLLFRFEPNGWLVEVESINAGNFPGDDGSASASPANQQFDSHFPPDKRVKRWCLTPGDRHSDTVLDQVLALVQRVARDWLAVLSWSSALTTSLSCAAPFTLRYSTSPRSLRCIGLETTYSWNRGPS